MNYLIFCSFEVGGLPYKMAEILNRHNVKTYYISIAKEASGHDSTRFHYGDKGEDWNLSGMVKNEMNSSEIIKLLKKIKETYNIKYCLATGEKSYLLKKAGINYHYWSYGADVDQCTFLFIFYLLAMKFMK